MEYRGYTISIEQDEMAESPINSDRRVNTIMFIRRYRLGDKHSYADMDEMFEDYARFFDYEKYCSADRKLQYGEISVREYWKEIRNIFFDNVIYENIYAYSHGGIVLSNTPFNDTWDSGLVGIIFVKKEDAQDVFNGVANPLVKIIEEYSHWINGDCWIGRIEKGGEELVVECYIGDYDKFEKELKEKIDEMEKFNV